MSDEIVPPENTILDQTLGDLLSNNPQAQQMITQSMGISQEKFQEMLHSAQQNNMMQMKIGDLFKNGIVKQATQQFSNNNSGQASMIMSEPMQIVQQQQVQLTPEQMKQFQNGTLSPQQLMQQTPPTSQKISLFDKLKGWFK